jgi:uncharacterized protein
MSIRIAVVGGTGRIGSRVAAEAVKRGHSVTGLARNVPTESASGIRWISIDSHDPITLARAIAGHDVVITALKWNENNIDDVLAAIRRASTPRLIAVVGAGSLIHPNGRLQYDIASENGTAAPSSRASVDVYKAFHGINEIDWTLITPPLVIRAGERTGEYRVGSDYVLFDSDQASAISYEDFAVAAIDEIEIPKHPRSRFTVAH